MSGHGISRVGLDSAGGTITGGQQDFVTLDGVAVVVVGDGVAGHAPHLPTVMAEGTSWLRIDGIPVCREGHRAACGHAATGASWIRITD